MAIGTEEGDKFLVVPVLWVAVTPLPLLVLSAGDDGSETTFWAPSNGLAVLGSIIICAVDTSTLGVSEGADTSFSELEVPEVVLLDVDFGFETLTLDFFVTVLESAGFECDVVESKGVTCLAAVETVGVTAGSTTCLKSADLCSVNE